MPLADQGAQLISRYVHAMEIRQAMAPLDFFALQLDFPEALVFIKVQVCKVYFINAPSQRIRRKLCKSKKCSTTRNASVLLPGAFNCFEADCKLSATHCFAQVTTRIQSRQIEDELL